MPERRASTLLGLILRCELPIGGQRLSLDHSHRFVKLIPLQCIEAAYASKLLTAEANPWYVAQQLGHEDVEMVFRTYGK